MLCKCRAVALKYASTGQKITPKFNGTVIILLQFFAVYCRKCGCLSPCSPSQPRVTFDLAPRQAQPYTSSSSLKTALYQCFVLQIAFLEDTFLEFEFIFQN
jgi:hypothetical protein